MKFKIGFKGYEEEKKEDLQVAKIRESKPVKSVVQVRFPSKGRSLAYYNDKYDLHVGDIVFVDGKLEKLSQINVKGTAGRLDRPFYFSAGYSAVDITFKPFTISGEPMCADMDNSYLLFGRLYGEIRREGYDEPIVLDNAQAHLLFHVF